MEQERQRGAEHEPCPLLSSRYHCQCKRTTCRPLSLHSATVATPTPDLTVLGKRVTRERAYEEMWHLTGSKNQPPLRSRPPALYDQSTPSSCEIRHRKPVFSFSPVVTYKGDLAAPNYQGTPPRVEVLNAARLISLVKRTRRLIRAEPSKHGLPDGTTNGRPNLAALLPVTPR